jgi:hypothetical protein
MRPRRNPPHRPSPTLDVLLSEVPEAAVNYRHGNIGHTLAAMEAAVFMRIPGAGNEAFAAVDEQEQAEISAI